MCEWVGCHDPPLASWVFHSDSIIQHSERGPRSVEMRERGRVEALWPPLPTHVPFTGLDCAYVVSNLPDTVEPSARSGNTTIRNSGQAGQKLADIARARTNICQRLTVMSVEQQS